MFYIPIRKQNSLYVHLGVLAYTLEDRSVQDKEVREISFDGIYMLCKPRN